MKAGVRALEVHSTILSRSVSRSSPLRVVLRRDGHCLCCWRRLGSTYHSGYYYYTPRLRGEPSPSPGRSDLLTFYLTNHSTLQPTSACYHPVENRVTNSAETLSTLYTNFWYVIRGEDPQILVHIHEKNGMVTITKLISNVVVSRVF